MIHVLHSIGYGLGALLAWFVLIGLLVCKQEMTVLMLRGIWFVGTLLFFTVFLVTL